MSACGVYISQTTHLCGFSLSICTVNGPGKCRVKFVVIWKCNTFIIITNWINRCLVPCSCQQGRGSVSSLCGPGWTCLLLHPQINYISCWRPGQTSLSHFGTLIFFLSPYQTDTDIYGCCTVISTTLIKSLPVWQFVFKVKLQFSFCCCTALHRAVLESFYFLNVLTLVWRLCQ